MLDDTLVLFTTEFGRTPFAQSNANQVGPGRDHNKYGFSCWLAGGGVKAGFSYGKTDEIGWKTVENPVHWHDFHATVLHLMAFDCANGVLPNSVVNSTSVSSSIPRCLRSRSSPAIGLSIRPASVE